MRSRARKAILTYLSILSIFFNTIQPFAIALLSSGMFAPTRAVAQEPSPEPSVSAEPLSTPEPSTTTIDESEESSDPSPSPSVSPTPSIEVSPLPSPSTDPVSDSDPQIDVSETDNTDSTDTTISMPEPDIQASLEESSAQTLASVTTDKPDYSPSETVLITGADLEANTTYLLRVSSTDPPEISEDFSVTTDDSGLFIFSYQLDGTYRPNYLVEVFLGNELVTSTTFTDTNHYVPTYTYAVDTAGPNDEPGQKDLNQMGVDYSQLPTTLYTTFNWDETSWTGENTGDACNLFDTDNDGFANYSLCVIVEGDPATYQTDVLYSCGDARADRCTSPVVVIANTATCTASVDSLDPFTVPPYSENGDDFPDDTVGYCEIPMSDFSSASAQLLDVCSYPSGQPNSDPSDCIIFRSRTGKLEVVKDLIPSTDPGLFNLQINGTTYATNIGDGGTTGEQILDTENNGTTYTIGETAGTDTNLSNYNSSIECRDLNGTGEIVASSSDSGPLNVLLETDDDIICTVTNTRNPSSITIDKVTDPSGSDQYFNFTLEGTSYQGFTSLKDTSEPYTFNNLYSGTYSVIEQEVSGWTLDNVVCTDGENPENITLDPGQNVTCTFYNSLDTGTIIVEKQTNPDGHAQSFDFTGSLSGSISDGQTISLVDVPVGQYTTTEGMVDGWVLDSISCSDNNSSGNLDTRTATFNLEKDETITCIFTNNKTPLLTVVKQIVPTDYSALFNLLIDGQVYASNVGHNGTTGKVEVSTGLHTVSETAGTDTNLNDFNVTYSQNCVNGEISLNYGDDETCYITNSRKIGTVTFLKIVEGGDATPTDWQFDVKGVGTFVNGTFKFYTGIYSVEEISQVLGYTASSVGGICTDLTGSSATLTVTEDGGTCSFTNTRDTGSVTVNKKVDTNGDGTYDAGNEVANALGFAWKLDSRDYINMGQTANNVTTTVGDETHTITELISDGYHFSGWYYDNGQGSCDNPDGRELPFKVTVSKDTNTSVTICNTRDTGSIVVTKIIDVDGNLETLNDREPGVSWSVDVDPQSPDTSDPTLELTNQSGYSQALNIKTGTYYVEEDSNGPTDNYHFLDSFCYIEGEPTGNSGTASFGDVEVKKDLTTYCTFINTRDRGMIEGHKFEDLDGDKEDREPGEPGLSSWEIQLLLGDTVIGSTTTTESGYYSFEDVLTGTYTLCEVQKEGWVQTYPQGCVQIKVSGEPIIQNFGNFRLGYLEGYKWNDLNGDGVWDQNEPAIGNWNIYLDRPEGNDLQATTDQNGYYRFDDLYPGFYSIYESLTQDQKYMGWTQTAPDTEYYALYMTSGSVGLDNPYNFGNVQLSNIHGYKWHDVNLDGEPFNQDGEEMLSDWAIELYKLVDNEYVYYGQTTTSSDELHYGWYWFKDLLPGQYKVCEVLESGWTQTYPNSLEDPTCHFLNLPEDGDPRAIDSLENAITGPAYNFGNVKHGSITVNKFTNPQRTRETFKFLLSEDADMEAALGSGESYTFSDLLPGNYSLTEIVPEGWFLYESICDEQNYENGSIMPLNAGQEIVCNFTNYAYGEVLVTKFSDMDGDGYYDENEQSLEGWEINLVNDQYNASLATSEKGIANFTDLMPGSYTLSETTQEGWDLTNIYCTSDIETDLRRLISRDTSNNHELMVYPGRVTECFIGNKSEPQLTISKSNDSNSTESIGNTVVYTLVVKLENSDVFNVQVLDLPPEGFIYQTGSWTANSDVRGDLKALSITTEPTYASPGIWNLADMVAGETVTLTYEAVIDQDVDEGEYRDLAFARACPIDDNEDCLLVYASGVDSEYVDSHFVGTSVDVDRDNRETGSVDIEGEVLGASTSLPATGASQSWLILAIALLTLGLSFILFSGNMTKKIKGLTVLILFTIFLGKADPTLADNHSDLSVRIEQPETPTRNRQFDLSYTALSLDPTTVNVDCYYKKPGGSFQKFDSGVHNAGGGSGICEVEEQMIESPGNYEFYAVAYTSQSSLNSQIVTVEYDNEGPGRPDFYSKEKPSECRWVIKFNTADDNGETVRVEIFSSKDTSFPTDSSTRVGEVWIGSNEDGEFIHDRASECSSEWYYVIRAYDAAGNQSAHIGDSVVTTIASTTEETEALLTTTSSVTSGDDDGEGDILGEETEEGEETTDDAGITSEISDAVREALSGENRYWWYLLIALVVGWLGYNGYKRYYKKQE